MSLIKKKKKNTATRDPSHDYTFCQGKIREMISSEVNI